MGETASKGGTSPLTFLSGPHKSKGWQDYLVECTEEVSSKDCLSQMKKKWEEYPWLYANAFNRHGGHTEDRENQVMFAL